MPNDGQFRAYDIEVAKQIASLQTTVHETVIPLLRQIEENCRARCSSPPPVAQAQASAAPPERSSAWFWGKVAGGVTILVSAITTIGVAIVQKAPEILAAVSAFFNPPKHP
jgi:hypothetical protein